LRGMPDPILYQKIQGGICDARFEGSALRRMSARCQAVLMAAALLRVLAAVA
jgi:hypothetical protein